MAIIIPHQLPLAPHPLSPLPFSADRFPIHSGPLFCFHQSAFLFPAIFSPVPFGLLSCFLWSAFLFPSFRLLVPFGPLSCSLCSASSFLSVRYSVSFGLLLCFLRFVCLFLLACSFVPFVPFLVSFGLVLRGTTSYSAPFPPRSLSPFVRYFRPSQIRPMPFSVGDHALQRSRQRLSCPKNTPFNVQEDAFLLSSPYVSDFVSVASSVSLHSLLPA